MKTTLKRGVGRAHAGNGSGKIQLPPGHAAPVTVYRQPEPPRRSRVSLALAVLGWTLTVILVCVAGVAGGAYLYLHESVAAVAPHSLDVKAAAKKLDLPIAGQPATALVIGYDRRSWESKATPSRSDTLMLIRADPGNQTISLLSVPRDLQAEIICPGKAPFVTKVNAAYSYCGSQGSLDTLRKLTGVPVNYLITVNFQGFRQVVDKLGGIWMDVDQRYLNTTSGPTGYAQINLQPGYQKLSGSEALDYVRFRHTDSDLYRNARQQSFVRAFKDEVQSNVSLTSLPKVIKALTSNIEVAQGGGQNVSAETVLSYAVMAYGLPPGHVFQSRIEGLTGNSDLTTSQQNIEAAVRQWENPDVASPTNATAVALGEKVKATALPPSKTTVTVLNGNGITGSASNASYLLGQLGYPVLTPPNGVPANAPSFNYFRTAVYFDARQPGAKRAAAKVAGLFGSADVRQATGAIRALANGAMLTTVVGQTFHGTLAPTPVDQTPKPESASVAPGAAASLGLLRQSQKGLGFPLMVPTMIERSSWIDRQSPIRVYSFDGTGRERTVRLVYKTGGLDYWGVQESHWKDAPVLAGSNIARTIGGRRYSLYYNGPHLHMVVLYRNGANYWVVNSLLDRLSNETMLAIAKGLEPVSKVRTP